MAKISYTLNTTQCQYCGAEAAALEKPEFGVVEFCDNGHVCVTDKDDRTYMGHDFTGQWKG